ncbi:hypothetical protein SAMN05216553_118158 [Lentzea fradiae]|uniref:Uncharacterized protein n=1 Tax=Lentzea fradiae TaxID=200378 RepID=A0A1G8AY83_9PSEU|nr:hypothetical protein SAMN05216553_118158 [Lentzea fradiae]
MSLGAPAYLTDALGNATKLVVLPIALGVVYPLLRKSEASRPDWLPRILLGSAQPPTYFGKHETHNDERPAPIRGRDVRRYVVVGSSIVQEVPTVTMRESAHARAASAICRCQSDGL